LWGCDARPHASEANQAWLLGRRAPTVGVGPVVQDQCDQLFCVPSTTV
jgi:hypothetical protein